MFALLNTGGVPWSYASSVFDSGCLKHDSRDDTWIKQFRKGMYKNTFPSTAAPLTSKPHEVSEELAAGPKLACLTTLALSWCLYQDRELLALSSTLHWQQVSTGNYSILWKLGNELVNCQKMAPIWGPHVKLWPFLFCHHALKERTSIFSLSCSQHSSWVGRNCYVSSLGVYLSPAPLSLTSWCQVPDWELSVTIFVSITAFLGIGRVLDGERVGLQLAERLPFTRRFTSSSSVPSRENKHLE